MSLYWGLGGIHTLQQLYWPMERTIIHTRVTCVRVMRVVQNMKVAAYVIEGDDSLEQSVIDVIKNLDN
jgi:hypothetical protein